METAWNRNVLIELQNIDVESRGHRLLRDVTWKIQRGEHWGVFGANGSGKSTLLKLLRGDLWPSASGRGSRIYRLNGEPQESAVGVKRAIGYVSSELHDLYVRNDWEETAWNVIATGFEDTPYLYSDLTPDRIESVERLIDAVGLRPLAEKSFAACSRGEARKILIARALVSNPAILILDEMCSGLDRDSRARVFDFLQSLPFQSISMLFTSHRFEEAPLWLNKYLFLAGGAIVESGEWTDESRTSVKRRLSLNRNRYRIPTINRKSNHEHDFLIDIRNASVILNGQMILRSIHWTIRPDENWAILGENGSGKSTLLSLIYSDVWPQYGGTVCRFNQTGLLPKAEIKKRVGLVSPQLQGMYTYDLTAYEVVQSGFYASIGLYDGLTESQNRLTDQWMEWFDIHHLSNRLYRSLSYGEQRKVILARAMVLEPELLLLDEPCDGLDFESRQSLLRCVDSIARTQSRVVFVTHHEEDLIPSITHRLTLSQGSIVTMSSI